MKVVRGLKQGRTDSQNSLIRVIWRWLFFIFMAVVLVFVVVHMVNRRTRVEGVSMYPTLADGDEIIIDNLSFHFFQPRRFDVIVFPARYLEDTWYVKRIIGLPGETVQIIDGEIYINGNKLKEPHHFERMETGGVAISPVTLGENEYFVLGDNRNASSDSREPTMGNIRRDEIIGKAVFRIRPLRRIGPVN